MTDGTTSCAHDGWMAGCVSCEREQAAALELVDPAGAPRCPTCDRVMSDREAAEQGSCNDCYPGGAWSP